MRTKREKFAKRIGIFVALVVVICAAFAFSVFAEEPSGIKGNTCYTHGDVNADGVVTSKDAIYLLYHSVDQEEYPIEQDGDFDGDNGEVTKDDAIHLLYSVNGMFGDIFNSYKLKGEIHAYGEPIWELDTTGDEAVATAYYRCACGQKQAEVVAEVTVVEEVLPTCTEAGKATYSLNATYADVEYNTTKTVVLDAAGHNYGVAKACEERECQNEGCGYIEKAAGHNFGEPVHTVATCTAAEKYTYTCQDCNFTYTEEVGLALGHSLGTSPIREEVVDASNCTYQQIYMCGTCQQEVEGQIVTRHAYKAAITKEATCRAVGEKTYTCTQCDDSYKEEIAQGDHVWNDGVAQGTNTVYTCTVDGCNVTKRTVDTSETPVSAITLKNREVETNGAFIKLDENTTNFLGTKSVQVTATEADKATLNLSEEEQAQIGNNPIYDFTMTAGGEGVTDFEGGIVTVTLPYELQPGDDVDCIHVWYIDDDGNVAGEPIKGIYSNGYVTFKTTHFSYYTVTRLTPAQRCAAYGHSDTTREVEKTCETDGYTLHVCVRCAETWKDNIQLAEGHQYTTETTGATCTTAGSKVETCGNCSSVRTTVIPATGHNWSEVDSKVATCTAAGYVKATCGNTGCSEEKNEIVAQLKHDTTQTEVAATCETRGYILEECKDCDYKEKTKETDALGHDFKATWNWDEENLTAVLTLSCQTEDCTHSVVKNAVVDITKQDLATCSKAGSTVYSASFAYNQTVYSEEWEVAEAKLEHKASEEWDYNSLKHYHTCILCESRVDEAEHAFDEGTVATEPTCTNEGVKLFVCACGYEKEESISALGHELENGACTRCEFDSNECDHEAHLSVEKVITDDSVCGEIYIYYGSCECGEKVVSHGYEMPDCNLEWSNETVNGENGYAQYHSTAVCEDCGMTWDETSAWKLTDECMGTLYNEYTISTQNGETLFAFSGIEAYDVSHPAAIYSEEVDLTEYGLCGGSAITMTCPCGISKSVMLNTKACEFEYIPEESEGNSYTTVCSECGVKKVDVWGYTDLENCQISYSGAYTFYKEDTQLCQFEYIEFYEEHDTETSFVKDGDSCSDGYTVYHKCKNCEWEDSYYEKPSEGEHYIYYQGNIDVSEYDICGDTMSLHACPCGEESSVYYYDCDWRHLDYVDELTENGVIHTNIYECVQCGLVKTNTRIVEATDKMCIYDVDSTTVYEKDGQTILTTHELESSAEHEYLTTDYTLLGEDCEDGVRFTQECQVCGYAYTSTNWGHMTFTKESYDLADYGMCGGTIAVDGCACGENEYIHDLSVGEESCNWQHWYYNEATGTSTYKCSDCGLMRNVTVTEEQISGCLVTRTEKYEYLKGYNVVLSVESVRDTYSHHNQYSFELNGTVCSDGYKVIATCKYCDYSDWWTNQPEEGEHWTYEIQSYNLSDYGFCGGEVHKYSCPCGENTGIGWNSQECSWEWYRYDDATSTTMWHCMDCGGFRSSKEVLQSEEGCYRYYLTTEIFYDKDMVEKLTLESTETHSYHNSTYNFTLYGTTCSDGYEVSQVCSVCGYEQTYYQEPDEGEHWTYQSESYDLSEYGFCGGAIDKYACPCGERTSFSWDIHEYCDYRYTGYDETMNTETYTCQTCGGSYAFEYTETEIDDCHSAETRAYCFYDKDGQKVCEFEEFSTYEHHDNEYTFTLNGNSCEEGYIVHMECQICGNVSEGYNSYHERYLIETINLEDCGFCAGTIEKYACPCGEEEHTEVISYCNWSHHGYDSVTGTTTWKCTDCNGTKKQTTVTGEKDANCQYQENVQYQYINQEGEVVCEYERTYTYEDHDEICTFEMLGDSCEDGYYVIHICEDCDYTYRDSYLRNEHQTWTVGRTDLAEKGMCDGTLYHYQCACGADDYYSNSDNCSWNYDGYVDGCEQYTCQTCGTVRSYQYGSTELDACHTEYTNAYTFSNDVTTWSYGSTRIEEHHDYLYELHLDNPEGTCEDGYTGIGTCTRCEDTYEVSGTYHEYYVTSHENLADKGMCENIVRVGGCACGEYTEAQIESTACYWSHQSTDEGGTEHYLCRNCNGTRTISRSEGEKDEECYVQHITTYTYYNSVGDEVFGYTYTSLSREHDYEVISVEMNGDSCEDGYMVTSTCKDCGRVSANSYSHHGQHEVKVYDLAEYGACEGAQITHSACYCGEYHTWDRNHLYDSCSTKYTTNMYKDDDGNRHDVSVHSCVDCGLRFTMDVMTVRDAATCTNTITTNVTIAVGSTAVDAVTYVTTEVSHDYEETAELMEGATSCVDGVVVTHTCRDCQDSYTTTSYYHNEVEVTDGRTDLSELGSECGGYVVHKSCACGLESSLVLEDADCDFDHEYESSWLGEYYDAQMTTQGTSSGWSSGFMQVCAVTDPEQCGFTIRGCTYYLRDIEHCQLVQYTTWQLGYDRTTGEYKKEITIATGDVLTYHDYVSDSEDAGSGDAMESVPLSDVAVEGSTTTEGETTTTETDTTTVVSKECSVCGSTHVHTTKENASGYTYYVEDELVNTLDNGENKYLHEIDENYSYKGYSYPVLDYRHVVYEDSSEYWYRHDYIYDWENFDCTRIHQYSDSEGDNWEEDETCHNIYHYISPLVDNTCTQWGTNTAYSQCAVCEQYFDSYTQDVSPSGHYWYDSDGDGIYQCSKCGLENINGADGQIVVEDLTDSHGEDTAYVVGYYNQNEVEYTYYVSVICNELAEDDENYEIVLSGFTSFTELTREENGINAISFSKEDAQNAAAEAMEVAGYTGDYDLRFAFVPVGSDGDFDYAITFTNETIEE